jgi:hypothetical protein
VSHDFCLLILANPFRTLPIFMEILEMMTEMTEMDGNGILNPKSWLHFFSRLQHPAVPH